MPLFNKYLFHKILYTLHIRSLASVFLLGKSNHLISKLAGKMLVIPAAGYCCLKNGFCNFNLIKSFYPAVSLGYAGKHFTSSRIAIHSFVCCHYTAYYIWCQAIFNIQNILVF